MSDNLLAMPVPSAVPTASDGYAINCDHGLFQPDQDINGRLHAAGFTGDQAQLLYDLAAERLIPMIQEIAATYQANNEIQKLVEQFGGDDRWREVSRQLSAWAGANLPPPAVEGLSTTYDGVMALYRMMTSPEPAAMKTAAIPQGTGEGDLRAMMRDPRYWRDRDPSVIAQVTEGFRRLYPGA